jgi:hypothetical protein
MPSEYQLERFLKTSPKNKSLRQQIMDYNPHHLGQGHTGTRNSTANQTQKSIPIETPPENTKTNINIGIGTMNFNMNLGGTQRNLRYQAGSISSNKRFQPVKILNNPLPQKEFFSARRPGASSLLTNSFRKRPASMCAQDSTNRVGPMTYKPDKESPTIRRMSTGQFFNPSSKKQTPFISNSKTSQKKDPGLLHDLSNRSLWKFNNEVKDKKLARLQSYYSRKSQEISHNAKPSLTGVKAYDEPTAIKGSFSYACRTKSQHSKPSGPEKLAQVYLEETRDALSHRHDFCLSEMFGMVVHRVGTKISLKDFKKFVVGIGVFTNDRKLGQFFKRLDVDKDGL